MVNYNDGELDPEYVQEKEKYQTDLIVKRRALEVSAFNPGLLNALRHPIRLVRTRKELKRIIEISYQYLVMDNTSITEFITEESGDVGLDLQNARLKNKPKAIIKFMRNNPVYSEEIDKKLLKIRK